MASRASSRLLAAPLSLVLLVFLAAAHVHTGQSPQLKPQSVTCPTETSDSATAAVRARECGGRVLVSGETDENSQTFANPDGTFTWESSVRSRFAKAADGSWVKADATLVTNPDGTISPKASTFPMAFSGGGATTPLITADRHGGRLSMSWHGTLPEPVLAGNVATYPGVMPGVDLRLIADVDGFSEHLVIKNREAAALAAVRELRFGMSTEGLTVQNDAAGGMSVVGGHGDVVFAAGTPLMWDSSDAPVRSRLLAEGKVNEAGDVMPRSRPVGLRVDQGDLVLTPDVAMLDDASMVYPLVIDPTVVGGRNHWTELSKSDPGVSYYDAVDGTFSTTDSTNGLARVGYADWSAPLETMRPVFEMNTSGVMGKGKVTKAEFKLAQRWSGVKCTDVPGPGAVGLYWTQPISSATNWNTSWNSSGSGWSSRIGLNSESHRTDVTGSCGPADVIFDITSAISQIGLGCCSAVTLGMKGEDETAHNTWKRYLNNSANSPTLSLTYDAKPTITSTSTSPATTCVTGASRPTISSLIPVLSAGVSDAENEPMSATFEWWAVGGTAAIGSATVSNVASGATASRQVPTGQLAGGAAYQWRVTVSDGNTSVTSAWCEFSTIIVDPQATGCPSTLTNGDFNGDGISDRVIGDPKALVGTQSLAGAVYLIDGATGAERTLRKGADGIPGTPQSGDQFGLSLVVYDANRDGCADLAIGAPMEDYGGQVNSGAVYLLYGSPQGLGKGPATMTIAQGLALPNGRGTVPDQPEAYDWFGYSLAGGVTSFGEPYLIIGAPGESLGSATFAGTVHYLRGALNLKMDGQSAQGAEIDDRSGTSVAASPYQLGIGSPGEAAGAGKEFSGSVCVLNHNSGATAPSAIRCLVQGDDTSPAEKPERSDLFGKSIAMVAYRPIGAAAGVADSLLVVGVPGEDVDTVVDAGKVQQFLVTSTSATQLASLHQGSSGIAGDNEPGDYFGERVVAVNLDPAVEASATTVLVAVGGPGEDLGVIDAGEVRVFAGGTTSVADTTVYRKSGALPGAPVAQELLGGWLGSDGRNLLVPSVYGSRAVYVIPWANLAAGNATPTITYTPGQGGIPSGVTAFGAAVG